VDNCVFVPVSVYDGNLFAVKNIKYPSYWCNKSEWKKDMPITATLQLTLGVKSSGTTQIKLATGSASTPSMNFFVPAKKQA